MYNFLIYSVVHYRNVEDLSSGNICVDKMYDQDIADKMLYDQDVIL